MPFSSNRILYARRVLFDLPALLFSNNPTHKRNIYKEIQISCLWPLISSFVKELYFHGKINLLSTSLKDCFSLS